MSGRNRYNLPPQDPSWKGKVWGAALFLAVAATAAVTMVVRAPEATTAPEALRVHVLRTFPHARDAFTQGLVYEHGTLYESTGLVGRSSLRRVDLETGRVLQKQDVPAPWFAEGLALVGNRLWQLTWKGGRAFEYDAQSFEHLSTHPYRGEGWGLCFDGKRLVMSDGSDYLTFRDPDTFDIEGRVRVTEIARPVERLNELECVDGSVYANVWTTNRIVRIDPQTGHVTASIDASGLLHGDDAKGVDVLNGIAYLPRSKHFLITGKLWPKMFEVVFVKK